MHIAQEIVKNIDTRTPDDVITLDYDCLLYTSDAADD